VSAIGSGRARRAVLPAVALAIAGTAVAVAARRADPPARPPLRTSVPNTARAQWPADDGRLAERLDALRLPGPSDTGFHIHVRLRIFVGARAVAVPAGIGIEPRSGLLAPLHTHDASGIVHIESERPYPFTLGQFFAVWGVRFSATRLGAYADDGADRLRAYVDGRRIAAPAGHVLAAHERIVIAYGRPGQAPTDDREPFPPGL
jgi:hypothetical protein